MKRIVWLRIATASIVLAVLIGGAAAKAGTGTVSSLSMAGIPFTCPLGYLEAALASRNLLPQLWLGVGLVLLSVVLFGRFFCAWICPTGLIRQLFGTRAASAAHGKRQNNSHALAVHRNGVQNGDNEEVTHKGSSWASYSGLAVLGGALASSFLFGFPVFCLICPMGLVFGTIFAAGRLIFANQPSIELILLPAILGFELFGLRRWCSSICPLGALLGLLARFNHTLRLSVERDKCLISEGIHCRACERACLYGFNISREKANPTMNACAKCFECFESCPTKAIQFSLFK